MVNPVVYRIEAIQESPAYAKALQIPGFVPYQSFVRVTKTEGEVESTGVSVELKSGEIEISDFKNTVFVSELTFYTDNQSPDEGFTLPLDPIIDIQNRNILKRRYVAKKKRGGTIKEFFTTDDATITISGTVVAADEEEMQEDVRSLFNIVKAGKTGLNVLCPALDLFNISRIAIETYDFPFTRGEENQEFTIKGYSDEVYELLIEEGANV